VPVETIGWPYSHRAPFRPCTDPVEVLFAPCHPLGNGYLPAACADSNTKIADALAELPVNVTVRWPSGDVADCVAAIEAADVVVAAVGTFPSLAVALGCPTIMTCQVRPEVIYGETVQGVSQSWPLWRDLVRYPLDADDTPDLGHLLVDACADDTAIALWRDRFVGDPFDPDRFVTIFEAAACG
jgi:hypothetical protein